MDECPRGANKRASTAQMDCLTTVRRRRAIRLLADRSAPLTEHQLAARLAARARGNDLDGVDEDVVRETQLSLRHVDLPKLAEAGLVAWDRAEATVTPTDHPILADEQFQELLQTAEDAVVEAVATEPCRDVLSVLSETAGDVTEAKLARRLATREPGRESSSDAVERSRLRLHHAVLPQLEAADLVERDGEAGTVRYTGPATLPGVTVGVGSEPVTDDESGSQLKIP